MVLAFIMITFLCSKNISFPIFTVSICSLYKKKQIQWAKSAIKQSEGVRLC